MTTFQENISYEAILKRMLDRVPDDVDKREGSIIYLALAPAAWEIYEAQVQRQAAIDLLMVDTSVGDILTRLCAQYGVNRRLASPAVRKGVFTDREGRGFNVPIGSRFGIDGLVYQTVNMIEDGQFELICESYGTVGNTSFGSLLPIEYIEGLATAKVEDVLIAGDDIESDDDLRSRYYERANDRAYGGNISDYKSKCRSISGVGGCKVYPTWNGGGTVKLVIIDVNYEVPNNTLIEAIQREIDPPGEQGQGLGIAPIGHIVTVVPCTKKVIDISMQVTLQSGYSWENVKVNISEALGNYMLDLKKQWEDMQVTIVRSSKIENTVLDIPGVINVDNIRINNISGNLTLGDSEIPVLGEVVNSAN